jgi:hypothetical protein
MNLSCLFNSRGDGVHYQINSILLGSLEEQQQQQQQSGNTNNDVILPMDTPLNSINNDRSYLLNENR